MRDDIILTPAPANTTDSVKLAQIIPDICPREPEFGELLESINKDLLKVVYANDDYTSILLTGSGTAAIESVISSVPKKGLLVIQNGKYGERIRQMAQIYKIPIIEITSPYYTYKLDNNTIEAHINYYRNLIDSVVIVHHETTTGILNDIISIGKIVKKYNLTYIIDAISSIGGRKIDVNKCQADFIIGSANKCLQGLPGISFIIAKKTSLEKCKYNGKNYYLNLYKNYEYFKYYKQTLFTPAIQICYALKQALNEYFLEGEYNRRTRYFLNWGTLVDRMIALGFKKLLNDEDESRLVTTFIEPEEFDFQIFHDKLKQRGFVIYPGKLDNKKTFRIGNIGDIDYHHIQLFIKAVKEVINEIYP